MSQQRFRQHENGAPVSPDQSRRGVDNLLSRACRERSQGAQGIREGRRVFTIHVHLAREQTFSNRPRQSNRRMARSVPPCAFVKLTRAGASEPEMDDGG